MTVEYRIGDVFDRLAEIPDGTVDLVVTSPPFLALRSYLPADHPDKGKEIGSETTPAEFLDVMLRVTVELRRVLAPHGSIAIELGDTYAGSAPAGNMEVGEDHRPTHDRAMSRRFKGYGQDKAGDGWPLAKSKTLIPELYRIALAYGFNPFTGTESPAGQWRIRNVVTWCRPNPPVGALGDKWRPATSDVVVACLSGKRYWDDLATRRPFAAATLAQNGRNPRDLWREGRKDNTEALSKAEFAMTQQGAPLLDYWVIPPGGYQGSHYAVFPPELVVPLVKAMCPQRVCRTCGEPSRRIVKDRSAFDVQPELAAHIKERRLALGITSDEINGWFGFKEIAKNWERTDKHGAAIPGPDVWPTLKERLSLSDDFDVVVLGDRHWTDDPAEYVDANGALVEPEVWQSGISSGLGAHSLKRTTATRQGQTLGWTDCGHDDWRPGLVLDPFAGSGTTLMVAQGHGHDAIGIDLDSRNAELALERVGPFFLQVVP